ncbi:MAG: type II toxin-antitoxin system death-on-curing family toxin [Candidatus Sericytochromatia bacterium]
MRYLTLPELLSVNWHVAAQRKGPFGLLSRSGLEEALARPQTRIDDYEPFATLSEKAAVLMDSLMKNRPFLSGNVLTALLAADLMLRLNGVAFQTLEEDLEQVQSISLLQMTIPQIADWIQLRSHSQA